MSSGVMFEYDNISFPPRHSYGLGSKHNLLEVRKRKPALFLHLASSSMKCLSTGLVANKDATIQNFIRERLQAEHISCLAWLVQNVDALISMLNASSKVEPSLNSELAGFGSDLMEMLQEMIVGGLIGQQYLQGVLLNELGLSTKCWPLHIPPASLSLLGRVLVCRLGEGQGNGNGAKNGDDRLIVNIWKG